MNPRTTIPCRHVEEVERIRNLLFKAELLRQEAGDILADLFDKDGRRINRGLAISESVKEPLWELVERLIHKTGHVHVTQQVELLSEQ